MSDKILSRSSMFRNKIAHETQTRAKEQEKLAKTSKEKMAENIAKKYGKDESER